MDALPPDPYLALGVAKDATAAAIKTQYRKLVLKCHPDKIQDETLKQEASDRFHKIQTAYEIISDEDRRARYDAQCKLADLRKDVLGDGRGAPRSGGVDVRTAAYKMPTESARGGDFYARGPERFTRVSPQYEERRPSYAHDDYFEQPRPTSRKYDDYERSSKRSSPKDERPKAKASARDAKENERSSRKEKSRRMEKDVRRERDRKPMYTATVEVDSDSDSDPQERNARRMRAEDDEARYQRERAAREQYYETARKQHEEAESGAYHDERTRKMFTDTAGAADYIARSRDQTTRSRPDSERRPSLVRKASSREKIQLRREASGKPPVMYRTGSGRPKPTTRDSTRSTREKERQPEVVEEVREPRRGETREKKPSLTTAKSAPEDIRPPFDRQRSHSLQDDEYKPEPAIPQMRRSETMPVSQGATTRESRGRKEGSKLRPEDAYVTPERTPEPEARSSRYHYGTQYADDMEFATPDGYRTVEREPSGSRNRYTRSPSPMKERERQRSASDRKHTAAPQPPPLPRTTSTQYVYPGGAREDSYSRPAVSRENSGRLYGEIRTSSPRQSYTFAPPPEKVHVRPNYGAEDVKIQTGYTRRPEKPSYSRGSSGRQAVYA